MEPLKAVMNTEEAGFYLGYSIPSMRKSIQTGRLGSMSAPAHFRLGGNQIRYKKEVLDQWISQAEKASQTN